MLFVSVLLVLKVKNLFYCMKVEMARAKRASIVFKVLNVRTVRKGWKGHPFETTAVAKPPL